MAQRWWLSPFWYPRPMLWAIAATCCAAALVLYFQYRAVSTLQAQTEVILRQVSRQTATDIAVEVQQMLDGPVFNTLTAVNHPELRAGRLDLVAAQYKESLEAYPHVERFLVWNAQTDARTPGEALFFERGNEPHASSGTWPFTRDPALGRAILALAERHAGDQRIYIAADITGDAPPRQVLLRLFWTDAERVEYFAILGFVVNPATMGAQLFNALHAGTVGPLLQKRGGDAGLRLHVVDEHGASVYGQRQSGRIVASSRVPLPLVFYPADRIESRLSGSVPSRAWSIEVTAPRAPDVFGVSSGYWPAVLSLMLMLFALALTVQANRRAEEFARMQADFISHVSHQLKTPLSLLSAVSETVAMDRVRSPEKLAQYVGIIRSEVSRLSVLVKRILEFSRLEQQRAFEFEQIDVVPLVRETVCAFARSLSDVQFHLDVHADAHSRVLADSAAIEQALLNLLDNAVKYSGDNREVTVRVRVTDYDAVIEVADKGIGISAMDERRVFEKFYRGAGATRHTGGFGLGLPIALQLVQAHRGRIEFTSAPGRGSTFRMMLPLASPARVTAPQATSIADVEVPR